MQEPLTPSTGWGVLHLFCRPTPFIDPEAITAAVKSCQADDHQVITVGILGHKADLGFMALGPDLWRLRRLQSDLTAAGLELVDSYVSLTEVSEYAKGVPEELKQRRLFPQLPPEGKRPGASTRCRSGAIVGQNWYTLPYDEREPVDARSRQDRDARSRAGCCS